MGRTVRAILFCELMLFPFRVLGEDSSPTTGSLDTGAAGHGVSYLMDLVRRERRHGQRLEVEVLRLLVRDDDAEDRPALER